MFKKLSTVFLAVLFLSMIFIGSRGAHAETFNDLTVKGDARFQYPIYADGGVIQFGGGDLRILDFNQGSSRIYNQGDLYVVTDDNLYFNFSNQSSEAMATFDSRMTVNNNFNALFPIYATGNEIVFNGTGVAVKTADSTPRIYRSDDTLRLMAPNMYIDVPGTVTVENDLTVSGDLAVTGSQTFGNTTFSGTITASGLASLNGGIAVDTNKFTVADSSGNTLIAGTLDVTGATTLSSTLNVTGNTTLTGDLIVNGGDISTDAVDLTIEAGTTTPKSLILVSDEATTDAINIDATAGGIDIDVADDFNVATTDDFIATIGDDMDLNITDDYTLDSASFSIDSTESSNVTVTGASADLSLLATGGSLVLQATESAEDAISITSTAGGINILATGASAGEDIDIAATGSSVNISSTEATVTDAIKLSTAADSSIFIDAGTTDKTADVMHFDVDVNSANVDGISMDMDVATALSAGEIANGMNIDVDGNAGDDAGSYVNGLFVTSANTSAGVTSGIKLTGAFDYFLNVAPTTNSSDLVNITMAANPNNTKALNINSAVTNASGTVTGISVDLTSLSPNNANVYNIWLESPIGGGTGNEYGIYLNGTDWDYAIYTDDNIRFGSGQNQTLDVAQSAADVAGKSLSVVSGAGGTATAAGLAGGAINVTGGAGSNAAGAGNDDGGAGGNAVLTSGAGGNAVNDGDGGDGGHIILTPGSGGTAPGAGDNGDSGDIYIDSGEYIVFGGTSSSVGDMKYDMLDSVWLKYVLNSTGGNVNQYDAVQYKVGAGADGTTIIQSNADNAASFAGIYVDDDGAWATGTNNWIVVHGLVGEAGNGVVDSTNTLADGDPFSTYGSTGGAGQIHLATDAAGSVGVGGFAVDETTTANDWIVFVRAM